MRAELQPLRVSCSSSRRVAAPIAELHTYARVARCNRRVARAPLSCNLNPELQPHLGQLQEVRFLLCGPSTGLLTWLQNLEHGLLLLVSHSALRTSLGCDITMMPTSHHRRERPGHGSARVPPTFLPRGQPYLCLWLVSPSFLERGLPPFAGPFLVPVLGCFLRLRSGRHAF